MKWLFCIHRENKQNLFCTLIVIFILTHLTFLEIRVEQTHRVENAFVLDADSAPFFETDLVVVIGVHLFEDVIDCIFGSCPIEQFLVQQFLGTSLFHFFSYFKDRFEDLQHFYPGDVFVTINIVDSEDD